MLIPNGPRLRALGFAGFLFWGTSSVAENSSLMLNFGGSPGEAVTHTYNYGLPEDAGDSYAMRIPVIYEELAAVFYDTEVTVNSADMVVQSIVAVRAYKSLSDCNNGMTVVKERLSSAKKNAAGLFSPSI